MDKSTFYDRAIQAARMSIHGKWRADLQREVQSRIQANRDQRHETQRQILVKLLGSDAESLERETVSLHRAVDQAHREVARRVGGDSPLAYNSDAFRQTYGGNAKSYHACQAVRFYDENLSRHYDEDPAWFDTWLKQSVTNPSPNDLEIRCQSVGRVMKSANDSWSSYSIVCYFWAPVPQTGTYNVAGLLPVYEGPATPSHWRVNVKRPWCDEMFARWGAGIWMQVLQFDANGSQIVNSGYFDGNASKIVESKSVDPECFGVYNEQGPQATPWMAHAQPVALNQSGSTGNSDALIVLAATYNQTVFNGQHAESGTVAWDTLIQNPVVAMSPA